MSKRVVIVFCAVGFLYFIATGCGGSGIASTGTGTQSSTGTYTGPATPGPTGTGTVQVSNTYYAYAVPAGHDSSAPWPMVVFLHGGGCDALQGLDHGSLAANQRSFIYIAPDSTGEDPYGTGTVKSWDWQNDQANITECMLDARDTWYIDLDRVYVVGHSLGSTMNVVYSTGPDSARIAAIGVFCLTWPWQGQVYGGGSPRKVPAYFSSQDGDGNFTATQDMEQTFNGYGHTTTFYDDPYLSGHTYDYQKIIRAYDWMKDFSL